MTMKNIWAGIVCSILFLSAATAQQSAGSLVVAKGKMPNIAKDKSNNLHIVYGTGDSIMYVSSKNGKDFSLPTLVAVLPNLFASAMRGPQIATSENGVTIMACTSNGNIFSYNKTSTGKWTKAVKVNDVNEVAKEALIALGGDGKFTYAVWLNVKPVKGQDIVGARSDDGGKTWRKNNLVYESPDGTVCECCKPSVVVKNNQVYVMFRNFIKGNRDLYMIKSTDGGGTFVDAQKMGEGSWKLNGCPMDGGGIAVDKNDRVETVWRREGKIFASTPGSREKEIGEGKGCSVETINGKNAYAWGSNGDVFVLNTSGIKKNVGKGALPLLKAVDPQHVICIWEDANEIYSTIVDL